MTTSATSGTGPTENSMRRALKRARDGVTLDVTEAAVLCPFRSFGMGMCAGRGVVGRL
ncbi:hypothetical protein OG762_49975 (plasmid) [Streptomyces sp. NBC_01136]|nr:hypothetical protein OG762_49975 [Streptomyces sp. NBC_01136]